MKASLFRQCVNVVLMLLAAATVLPAHLRNQGDASRPPQAKAAPTRADRLRGEYGRYRANNDLLYYHLDIRVDPDRKYISGKNTIRFKMLQADTRIQLDLHSALNIDKVLFAARPLNYERDSGAVFVDFPQTLSAGKTYSIEVYYS